MSVDSEDYACLYASVGWRVIPVEPRGKKPAIDAWQTEGSSDLPTLSRWFRGRDRNIGVVCGLSDLLVVDVDPRNRGAETFSALEAELGALPRTVTADTGGGGMHYVFRAPANVDLVSKLGAGVDLLHGGRQILVEPSVHPSGGIYRWRAGCAPRDIELAELPPTWLARSTRKPAPTATHTPRADIDEDVRVRRAIAYLAKMPPAIEGDKGSSALWNACAAVSHGFDLDEGTTRRIIVDHYNSRCDPPWSDAELDHTIPRAVERDKRAHDRGYLLRENQDSTYSRTPNDPVPDAAYVDRQQTKPRWQITPASVEWVTVPLPPREHLFVDERTGRGAVDRHGAWLMAGAGGVGKSYSTISKAMAVANGGVWLGTFRAVLGRALIIAAEDSNDDIRRRAYAIGAAEGYPPDAIERVHVLSLGDRVTSLVAQRSDVYTASADTLSLCEELAGRDPYDLVIVDPYGRIAGVSVDADNAAAAATISALAMIASAARGLVLGVTHTSNRARLAARGGAPEGATGVRGATGQVDYARGVLRLERDDADLVTLSLAKANHIAPWEPVVLRRGEHGELIPLGADERAAAEALRRPRTRDEKAAAKERDIRERDRLDDVAARQALGKHPGASVRALTAIVRGVRACGQERAHAAVARVRRPAEGDET